MTMPALDEFYTGLGDIALHAAADVSTKYQEVLQGRNLPQNPMPTDTVSTQTSEATPEVPFYSALAHYQAGHENHFHHEALTSGQSDLVPDM